MKQYFDENNLIRWSILNDPTHPIRKQIAKEWNELLANTSLLEDDYHAFLAKHIGFFFVNWNGSFLGISKLRLNERLIPDLLIQYNRYSMGNMFDVIELKKPSDKPFNKDGTPSRQLSMALKQIRSYKTWTRIAYVKSKDLLATNLGVDTEMAPFEFTVVIGRRDMFTGYEKERRELYEDGVYIISFDRLTDLMKAKQFFDFAHVGGSEGDKLSIEINNKLANPFRAAFTDKTWRNLIAKDKYRHHFIANNAGNIISDAKYSEILSDFMKSYRNDEQ